MMLVVTLTARALGPTAEAGSECCLGAAPADGGGE
jgi:hypothetical protein